MYEVYFWWFSTLVVILPNCIKEMFTNNQLFLKGYVYALYEA